MKQKENRVMVYLGAIVLSVGILLVIWAAFVLAEEVTITTYYPAPYGVYKIIRLKPFPSPPVAPDYVPQEGDMCVAGPSGGHHIYCFLNDDWRQLW